MVGTPSLAFLIGPFPFAFPRVHWRLMSTELEGEDDPARRVMDLIKNMEKQEAELMAKIEAEPPRLACPEAVP